MSSTSHMTAWDAIMQITEADNPNMPVVALVKGEGVECYNHVTDKDDYVDFEKESAIVNFIVRNGVLYVEVDL